MWKAHTKSRFGCKECKRRRIKCDEARPICVQCSKVRRQCLYLDTGTPWPSPSPSSSTADQHASRDLNSQPEEEQEEQASEPQHSSTSSSSDIQNPQENHLDDRYSLVHFELLQHFRVCLGEILWSVQPELQRMIELAIRDAVTTPYLMDELLAFSAAHKSTLPGDRQSFFASEAKRLQTRASSQFNSAVANVPDDDGWIPTFTFSTLLGQHVLFDTLSSREDLSTVLTKFTRCLGLNRGVRVIASRSWLKVQEQLQLQTRVPSELLHTNEVSTSTSGTMLDSLVARLDKSKLRRSSVEVCRHAISVLQYLFNDSQSSDPRDGQRFIAVQIWPVRVLEEYACLLDQRCPEALVILAYYAVLLHRAKDYWVVGGSGKFLIQSISNYLGGYWADWLDWPNRMLQSSE